MAAVLTLHSSPAGARRPRPATTHTPRPAAGGPRSRPERLCDPSLHRPTHPRSPRSHRDPAVFRRRRLVAAALGLGLVFAVAHAGAALGGSTLAGSPGRTPRVVTVVVQPGDILWSIAGRVAPHTDPRVVVDALVDARGSSTIVPGETLTWLGS